VDGEQGKDKAWRRELEIGGEWYRRRLARDLGRNRRARLIDLEKAAGGREKGRPRRTMFESWRDRKGWKGRSSDEVREGAMVKIW
jgi:hypothetical protein